MDWHKLQRTLYNLEPTDPREDLAKLQQSLQKPTPDSSNIDYINESLNVPTGSMPLNIDSVSDFAKLAGIKSKKVVTEDDTESKFGGFARGFQAVQKGGFLGPDAASNLIGKAVTPPDQKTKQKAQKPSNNKLKGSVNAQLLATQLNISNPQAFNQAVQLIKQGQPIKDRAQIEALSEAFVRLMQIDPRETQKVMTLLKRVETREASVPKVQNKTQKYNSIKEELYRRLNVNK